MEGISMNKINVIKNNLKKIFSGVALLCLLALSSQTKSFYNESENYDGLTSGHVLLNSGWIVNMYRYGAGKPYCEDKRGPIFKDDAVANLIRKFWYDGRPTKIGFLANIPKGKLGVFFGQLINYLYQGFPEEQENKLIDELLKYDPEYEEFKVLWLKCVNKGYKLEDKKFNELKNAKKLEQKKIKELQKEYKIMELNEKIAQASKEWGKKKGFSNVKKEIKKEYDTKGYYQALKKVREQAFEGVSKEIRDEYGKMQTIVKRMKAKIDKMVKKKSEMIKKTLLKPIRKSFEFCKRNHRYAAEITEGILWALFLHKLDLGGSKEKIKAMNDCFRAIDQEFKRDCNRWLLIRHIIRVFGNFSIGESLFDYVRVSSLGLLKDKSLDIPMLNLIYYSLNMSNTEVKQAIIQDILERGKYEVFKGLIHNLIEFPTELNARSISMILKSGLLERDEFFKRSVQYSLDQATFYNNKQGILEVLIVSWDMGLQEIVDKIIKNEHLLRVPAKISGADQNFDNSQENENCPCGIVYVINQLRKWGHTEFADKIEKNVAFGTDAKWVSDALRYCKNEAPDTQERSKLLTDAVCTAKKPDKDTSEKVEDIVKEDQVCTIQLENKKLYLNKSFLLL